MEKIPTIELFIKDEKKHGVFAISLVESPAIEENFVMLSEMEVDLKAIDDERRIVVGFVLVPDKPIYRKQKIDGQMKEFNITMSKETVSKCAELYMKNLNNNNTTVNHERPVKGCSVIEAWTVEDPKNDKSNLFNLKPKGGEWAVMMKLYNDEEYQKAKNGEYKGFSVEALLDGFEALSMESQIIDELKTLIENATKK